MTLEEKKKKKKPNSRMQDQTKLFSYENNEQLISRVLFGGLFYYCPIHVSDFVGYMELVLPF